MVAEHPTRKLTSGNEPQILIVDIPTVMFVMQFLPRPVSDRLLLRDRRKSASAFMHSNGSTCEVS